MPTKTKQTLRPPSPIQDNGVGNRCMSSPRANSENQNVSLIRDFKALVPPIFRGGPNFLEAEHWLKEINKILDVMEVSEERRVSLASFMLRDEAFSWWDMIKSTHDVAQMKWTKFEELLLANYFPKAIRRHKRVEFVHLLQKNMTVTEYAAKFTQLSRYAQHMVVDEQM